MVYINDQYRFIFIENPKSGSSAILKGLEKALKIKINRGSPKQAHLTGDQVKNMYPDKWGYLKVTTQREPFQRFCSSINYEPHRLNHCFNLEQLQKHLKNPNGCVYCKPQSEFTKECDFIIDMNNSQSNFNDFCKRVGLPVTQLTMENKSKKKFYTTEQLSTIYKLFFTTQTN